MASPPPRACANVITEGNGGGGGARLLSYVSLCKRVSHSEVQLLYRSEWKEGWPRLPPSTQVIDTSDLLLCVFLSSDTNCFLTTSADEWNGVKGEEGGTIRLVRVESQSRSRPFKKTPYWVHDDNLSLNPSGEPTLKMIKSIFHSTSLWPRSGVLKYDRGGRSRSGWMECFGDLPPFKEKHIIIQVGNMPNCQFSRVIFFFFIVS